MRWSRGMGHHIPHPPEQERFGSASWQRGSLAASGAPGLRVSQHGKTHSLLPPVAAAPLDQKPLLGDKGTWMGGGERVEVNISARKLRHEEDPPATNQTALS